MNSSLVKSRGSNAINGARGRILYNFSGSACEGYTSEFRQVSELDSGEGKTDAERPALDLLGGRRRQELSLQDRHPDERCRFGSPVDGIAERSGDHITVKLKQPEAKTFTLDGTIVFPTEQIQRIIAAARDGQIGAGADGL